MTDELEARLRQLEASSQVQDEVITALQAERLDAARLSDAVERLTNGTATLTGALLKVDKNQRDISALGLEIQAVEHRTVPAKQINRQTAKTMQRLIGIVLGVVIASLAALWLFLGFADDRAQEEYANCLQRDATQNAVKEYLTVVATESTNSKLVESAQRIVDLYPKDPQPCPLP